MFGSWVAMLFLTGKTSNASSLFAGEALVTVGGKRARALGDQLRSIDKKRLRRRLGRLSVSDLRDVEEAVRITLALHPP